MNWKEIKLATLQKMFAADGSNLVEDESTKDYIASMPQAANEGLQLLSTAGKFIIKTLCIAHNPIPNLLPEDISNNITQIIRGQHEFNTASGRSFYFECLGKGTATVYVNGEIVKDIILDNKQSYAEYRGLIANANDYDVKIVFNCDYPISIKNIAIYDADFEKVNEIPTYAKNVRYRLNELASDFYSLDTNEIYYEGNNETRYIQTQSFFQEGDKVLVLDRNVAGNYTIYYKAYPEKITTSTLDNYELPVDDEVVVLLPLYMASQLYKDDDADIAALYRTEFDTAFSLLKNKPQTPSAEEFVCESGWI